MPIIEVKDLSSGYGHNYLFRNISFSISQPAFVAVVGLNGSGKSTFLKTISKNQPFQGQVSLEGFNISNLPSSILSEKLAILEQKNIITFSIPVKELVVMGKFRHKKFFQSYSEEDYSAALFALKKLGIEKYADKNFNELSGGEQQLVWLAQLYLQNSNIWLLDEPTQQLDLYNKRKVFDFFRELVELHSKMVFCITHDLTYLSAFEGQYFINFSETQPTLKMITPSAIEDLIRSLENRG